mgnify:CR=1 FL=1
MSGGVDSSVAASLLKAQGYECIGCTMRLFTDGSLPSDDAGAARDVADRLGIPFYVFDYTNAFRDTVIRDFVDNYIAARTPNPCIVCNRCLKFDIFLRRARELHCSCMVTGHYARIEYSNGRYLLKKGIDLNKDQSYVLYSMTQDQLQSTRFPLGNMHKEEIRAIAAQNGFINAQKPDSQDICFVPDGDYARFMESYTGRTYPAGDFIDIRGNVLGRHKGAVRYTIGQRKGLGIAFGHPMYVCSKDMQENTVTLASNDHLFSGELKAAQLNWISIEELTGPMKVKAKIRYRHTEQPAVIYPEDEDIVKVIFLPKKCKL